MAINFAGAVGRYISRTTDLLDINAAFTISFWFQRASSTATQQIPVYLYSAAGQRDYLNSLSTGLGLIYVVENAGTTSSATINISFSTWYYIAIVRSAADLVTLYVNDSAATNARSVATRSAATELDMGFPSTEQRDTLAHIKVWSTNLSAAELLQERRSVRPVRTANLYCWLPTRPGTGERAKDYSGNGRDWSENGTLADANDPGIPWSRTTYFFPYAAASTYNPDELPHSRRRVITRTRG